MEQEKLNQLKLQAEQGGIEAQCELAYYYKKEKRDYGRALAWYLKAAEAGHSLAQCRVGRIYFDERNYEQAVYWLSKSAEQGDAVAQCELANCYENGYGVEKDLEKHIYWLRLSAEQENVDAMWRMFLSYARGIGVEKDVENAKYWYFKVEKCTEEVLREKAENGDIKSQGIMARLCGILQDDEGELYWIKRTADQGHFYAIYLLSDKYFHRGDFEESKRLMLILAKQSKSSNVFYDCGRAHERTGDIKGAIYWYKRVIRKGESNVEVAKIALKRMEKKLKIND